MNLFKIKTLLFLLIIFQSNLVSQSTLTADIILKNNDSLHSKIKIIENILGFVSKDEINVILKVKIFENETDTKVIHRSDIKKLTFVDYYGSYREFITNSSNEFVELIYDGKIKWYKDYRRSSYDQALIEISIFINENGEKFEMLYLNKKKTLKQLLANRPDLVKMIDEGKLDKYKMKEILERYDR